MAAVAAAMPHACAKCSLLPCTAGIQNGGGSIAAALLRFKMVAEVAAALLEFKMAASCAASSSMRAQSQCHTAGKQYGCSTHKL